MTQSLYSSSSSSIHCIRTKIQPGRIDYEAHYSNKTPTPNPKYPAIVAPKTPSIQAFQFPIPHPTKPHGHLSASAYSAARFAFSILAALAGNSLFSPPNPSTPVLQLLSTSSCLSNLSTLTPPPSSPPSSSTSPSSSLANSSLQAAAAFAGASLLNCPTSSSSSSSVRNNFAARSRSTSENGSYSSTTSVSAAPAGASSDESGGTGCPFMSVFGAARENVPVTYWEVC